MKKSTTQKALARKLGISPQLVSYHIKAGCVIALDDVQGWRDYLAEVGREGSLPEELRKEIGRARARLINAQAERAERENLIASGETMLVADAMRQAGEAWSFLFCEFERMKNELPPAVAWQDAVSAFKRIDAFVESIRTNAKAKFESIGK